MRTICLITLLTLAPALLATERPKSNVLGDECPELLLEEEMVQGEIRPLEDRVSLFLFYQRECEGCERYAMPRLQKLYETYAGSKCWQVFVINTAFDKEVYTHLSDVEETRKHLRRMDWTMPVARDLDELSNELFTLDDVPGVPQAVVVDENGVVRAHDWYSTEEEMDHVDTVFKSLAAGMNCHCVRMPREVRKSCAGIYKAIEKGDYAKAWDDADTMCKSYNYDEADKKDADYLKRFVEGIVEIRVERHRKDFQFDPEDSLETKDAVIDDIKKFKGVPGATDFIDEVSKWNDSPTLGSFRNTRTELEAVEDAIARGIGDNKKDDVTGKLQGIAERAKDTVLAERVKKSFEAIGIEDASDTTNKEAKLAGKDNGSDFGNVAGRREGVKNNGVRRPGSAKSSGGTVGPQGDSGKSSRAVKSGSSSNTGSESSRHRTVRSR